MEKRAENVPFFWMEESEQQQLSVPMKTKRKARPKKMEFVGWGSRPLIGFLQSIGKDISKQLSRYDVTAIINEYVKAYNLFHPEKRKRIMCDERLHSLFGKKSVARMKIYELLEAHFAEDQDESEDDFFSSSEEEENVCKQQKASSSDRKSLHQKKKVLETPKSCLAAIISENIKLVYLKRSLVQELLKYPETFEGKVVGSFVRIKSDPNDYFQKNSHQLLQVTGIKKASGIDDIGREILLQVSNLIKDIRVCMLSDDNFTEEECEDLRQRVKAGILKRPTVVEFEQKAQILHEDITKHWLVRELALLQNLIDRANEKGWRKELFEYLERKQQLQTPSEQSRLLLEVPKVLGDEVEQEATLQDASESGEQKNNGSPRSILRGASEISNNDLEANQNLPTRNCGDTGIHADFEMAKQENKKEDWPTDFVQQQKGPSIVTRNASSGEMQLVNSGENEGFQGMVDKKVTATQVIELSDDDDDDDDNDETDGKVAEDPGCQGQVVDDHPGRSMWHYLDPQGDIQGPFSLILLKRWNDADYFVPDFKVWKAGQSPDEAVLLREVLRHVLSN
ncbi:hypothetical protein F0562_018693 [Nyssa sinensis]|uniref:GYF domain-containing protein n=1 Tax=Nyssa sinensis TaxID=561372 RepID=A0A5J4ZD79_9ASTE|nr:hypothetical protein F0562_018693 [Nyssa sinensis]